jgi:hypothetical protein
MNVIMAGAATFSWINPKTGLPEVDKGGEPGETIHVDEIMLGLKYRFANFVEVVVESDERHGIVRAAFSDRAGMYRGPSFLRLDSAPVGQIGRSVVFNRQSATFRQLVGCRTESPEKIGSAVGAAVGTGVAVGGVVVGAKVGALAGVWAGPAGMFVGAVALGTVGYLTGREVAEFATAFPPIWTELELKVQLDGTVVASLVSHSLFPSNTLYITEGARAGTSAPIRYRQVGKSYDGDATRLKQWKNTGWGSSGSPRTGPTAGNPWGMKDPGPEICRSALERELPSGY